MTGDLDQLIRDADPARRLTASRGNPAAIRTGRAQHHVGPTRRPLSRAIGLALSVAVVLAIIGVAFGLGPGTTRGRLNAGEHRHSVRFIAQVLPSRYYCSHRGGNFDVPCGPHAPSGFVHVLIGSEVLVQARFNAPIAVDSKRHFYQAMFRLTHSRGCDAASLAVPSLSRIRAGQRVTLQTFVPTSCPGIVRVVVRYVPDYRTAMTTAVLPPGTTVVGRAQVLVR